MVKRSRAVIGWVMYDWANSAFSTTVMSVIFAVYFAKTLVPAEGARIFGLAIPGESLWGYMVSLTMVLVILLAPGLGALADHRRAKGRFLRQWTIVGALSTAALFWAAPGRLWLGFWLIFLALLSFELTQVFYNAFLNEVGEEKVAGEISGLGFAWGYIGGGLCLALNMWMIARPEVFHLNRFGDITLPVRLSVTVAGVWWLLFSIPTFLWVQDKERPDGGLPVDDRSPKVNPFKMAMAAAEQILFTVKDVLRMKDVGRFLLAYLIFNDGIQTVLIMASIFGAKALGMTTPQLALCFLLIQFVAFFGAKFFGPLADRWSHRNVVLTTIAVYAAVVAWALFMKSPAEFWVMGVIIGFVLGASQSAARSLFAVMIPPQRSGEFFALYSVVGKAASLMGPVTFGVAAQLWGLRAGVGSLLLFFLAGGGMLFSVNELRGRAQAGPRSPA